MHRGLICFIDNIKSDVDVDMGFFEDSEDSIYPKVMSIGLTLHVLNQIGVNSVNKNYYGFGDPSSKLQDDYNKFYVFLIIAFSIGFFFNLIPYPQALALSLLNFAIILRRNNNLLFFY